MGKKITVTSALPYANGPLHIGHIAGAYLPADIFVRYQRAINKDVAFICGSDEHGAAITIRAKKEGVTPQDIVDKYHTINKKAFEDLGISFDIFHRTSSETHKKNAQEFFKDLAEKDAFVKKTSQQYYDEENDQFLADRYILGTCPKCSNDNAYGDQCEKCGSDLSPTDLINPRSTLSGNTPILKETTHWFLPMEKETEWLKDFIEKGLFKGEQHHDVKEWKKHVIGQCKSWLDGGLGDRAMTRDLDWGVPVPLEDADGKVLYVWFDAPIGYISATQDWAKENNKDWKEYWNDDAELVHFIAKDNIVFHCIIFPILLKLKGDLTLPTNVPANEFLNLEGDKISTSRNWAVWVHEYLEDFPGKEDVLRYVMCSIMPENKDAEFTWAEFVERNNSELVANLGNFANRSLVLTHKYYDGVIPTPNAFNEQDKEVLKELQEFPERIGREIAAYKFKEALNQMMNVSRLGNKYLADNEPWKLIKTDEERVKTVMYVASQILTNLSVLMRPFLPFTSQKLQGILNVNIQNWEDALKVDLLASGTVINQPELLFEKLDKSIIDVQMEKLEASKAANQETTYSPVKEEMTFDDFMKIDLRVGTIVKAEKIKKANKLLHLEVDLGFEKRSIVSGIAEHYAPEEVIGQKVSVVCNLAPRKMRGVMSEGMILMSENQDGKLFFTAPSNDAQNGSEIR